MKSGAPKLIAISCVLLFSLLFSCMVAGAESLRPAGYSGFSSRDLSGDDRKGEGTPNSGIVITKVFAGSPAELAGMQNNDIVVKYDQTDIKDVSHLMSVIRTYHADDRVIVTLFRDGKEQQIPLVMTPYPREKFDDVSVEYTSFPTGKLNLRAVILSPTDSENKKLPAVLLVSALGSPRLAAIPGYDLARNLAQTVARKGFRVMRFELRGYGDSEGDDYRTQDWNTEVSDNLCALDYLMQRKDVDNKKVFVFGHSTGGQIAAILAGSRDVAGLITSSTIGRTLYERSLETLRIQGELRGDSPAQIDRTLKAFVDLLESVSRDETLDAAVAHNPDTTRFVTSSKRIMDDRTGPYWKQQIALNLPEIYGKVKAPVLIIHGTSDFLTTSNCHKHINDVLKASGNKDVTLADIPNMDHRYSVAADMRESFEHYKTGDFKPLDAPFSTISEWLSNHLKQD